MGLRVGIEVGLGVVRVLGNKVRMLDGFASNILDGALVVPEFGVPPLMAGGRLEVGVLVGAFAVGVSVFGRVDGRQ